MLVSTRTSRPQRSAAGQAAIRLALRGGSACASLVDAAVSLRPEDSALDSAARAARAERFVAMGEIAAELAHELRNALQIVSANVYLARQAPAASEPYLAKIDRSTRLAQALVDDLMALARGEPAHAEPMAVSELLELARDTLPDDAADFVDAVPSGLVVRAHPGLAARLLHALYDNAIRAAAPARARVTTTAAAEGARVVLTVADEGPGVPEEIAATLFEPLVTRTAGGTGLGLALARRIADAHHGSIAHVPTASGAVFRVELPGASR